MLPVMVRFGMLMMKNTCNLIDKDLPSLIMFRQSFRQGFLYRGLALYVYFQYQYWNMAGLL